MTGTLALVRLALRRDRVRLPVWLALFVVTAAFSASATVGLYPDQADRVSAARAFNGAQALVALYGRVYDPTSVGSLAMVKLGGLGAIFVAILAILTTVRHTRADEESGRQELVAAGVVGRLAPLSAALVIAGAVNVVLAAATALGLVAAGLPVAGSFAFGTAWGGVGVTFAGITAVVAQLARSARTVTGLAVAFLGVVYVLRAVGDTAGRTGPRWLTWLSPIGWGQQFRPYAGDRWWVLVVTLGFAAMAVTCAYLLVGRRDVGTGLIPERPGHSAAGTLLRSPFGLAWRLQRATLLAWLIGYALLGLVLGNIASGVQAFFVSPQARAVFTRLGGEHAIVDVYFAAMLGFLCVGASAYGIQAVLRLRGEEVGGSAELLLSAAIPRSRWILSHVVIALAGTAVLLSVAGAAAGWAYGTRSADPGWVGRLLAAALIQVPAAWALAGLTVAAFGITSRSAAVGWAALAGFVVLGEVGPMLRFNHWLMDVSPYTHTPKLPGQAWHAAPVLWLLASAAALVAIGVAGFERRDVT